ncbi:M20/M25/M40 family metallo-hydrolase [Candidatus Fermentibacteria bacterium]|nr:M20/M25/M40 family metallo-hydrolase [Candidatus Fermentibacteria bacterium]
MSLADKIPFDEAVQRYSRAIGFRTLSTQEGIPDRSQFELLHEFLEQAFPLVHGSLRREVVSGLSLLYEWPGRDNDITPVMLTAHQDVVPADEGSWRHPPFSGRIADGRVWGRGTIDYKLGLMGMLESCEALLRSGFAPRRTLFLAFGHDEEIGGGDGAESMVQLLEKRGIRCAFVLDEGGYVQTFPWMSVPLATVGLAEKGYATVRLFSRGEQAHASVPPRRTTVGNVCRAVSALEDNQVPISLCEPVEILLETCSGDSRDLGRLRDASADYLPEAAELVSSWPGGNALVRTTAAPTVLRGSSKENTLPGLSSALVNFRTVPGQTSGDVLDHVKKVVSDIDVEVELIRDASLSEPSEVSSRDAPEYEILLESISRAFPEVGVSPSVFTAATDSRKYHRIADNVYRFEPVDLGKRCMGALHSVDESVAVSNYRAALTFYTEYMVGTLS